MAKVNPNVQPPAPDEPEKSSQSDLDEIKNKWKKVQATEASEKKEQKTAAKKQMEEEEVEVEPEEAPPPTDGAFSEFMSDKDALGSALDKESGGIVRKTAPEERTPYATPPPGSIRTEGVEVEEEEPIPMPEEEIVTPFIAEEEGAMPRLAEEEPPLYEGGSEPKTVQATGAQVEQEKITETSKDQEKKKKEEDTSLLASQTKLSDLKVKKKRKPKAPKAVEKIVSKGEKELAPEAPVEKPQEKKVEKEEAAKAAAEEKGKLGVGETKKPSPFERLTPQEIRKKRLKMEGELGVSVEGISTQKPGEGKEGEMGEGKKEKDETRFLEASAATASAPLPPYVTPIAAVTPSAATPAYSKLSAEIFELFEKMGGVMVIKQQGGITSTTMHINLPNSVFNGAKIILDKYSTSPAFNVRLVGSPEAVKVFAENLTKLDQSFKQANFNFEVNLLPPSIAREGKSRHLIRRKGAAGDQGGGGGGQGKGKGK